MRKILIVITTAYVPTGGLAGVVMNYYRNVDRTGLQIDIASTNADSGVLTNELDRCGSKYFCLGKRSHVLSYFFRLYRLCKGYDVIHVNGNSATTVIDHLAAKMAGIKTRINHNHTSLPDHRTTSDILSPLFHCLYTIPVACSDLAGVWLYGNRPYTILHNAVDVAKYHYDETKRKKLRSDFGIPDNCLVMGHLGKIYKPKNHPYLVKVFYEFHKINPDSILFLVGDGVMRQEIEDLVNKLGLKEKVIFAGLRTDVPDMLHVMDCFVFPSIWEGLPLSVFEALSSGLPCFISDHITKEVMVSPYIHALSIDDTPASWAEYVTKHLPSQSREEVCRTNSDCITNAGYNIVTEAGKLRAIYINSV
jgi:glycosyltransferase involved in cell wall biosynthesis